MKAVRMRLTGSIAVTAAALIVLGGCSIENWDWFDRQGDKDSNKPVTRAGKSSKQSQTARSRPDKADDPNDEKARGVDEKVEQYVRAMNPTYDPSYQSNDFNATIRRQDDPKRKDTIRRAVATEGDQPTVSQTDASDTVNLDRSASSENGAGASAQRPAPKPVTVPPAEQRQEGPGAAAHQAPPPNEPSGNTLPAGLDTGEERVPVKSNSGAASTAEGAAPENDPGQTPARPPVVGQIKISSGPEPAAQAPAQPDASSAVEPRPAAANALPPSVEAQDTFKKRLEALEAAVREDPNDIEAQFRLRMMYLIDGQDDKALAPSDAIDEELQEMLSAHFQALIAARSDSGRDPAAWATRQLAAIEKLRNIVRGRADLAVPVVTLCSSIDGFGRYETIEPAEFPAGRKNRVLVYIGVDNYRTEKTASGLYRTLLSVRLSLLNKAGEEIWSERTDNIEDLARQRRRDFFLTYGPMAIPKALGPGAYVLKAEVEDVLAGKINSNTATFKLVLQ